MTDQSRSLETISVQRTLPFQDFATPDWLSRDKQFVVQQISEVKETAPNRLFVVIDSSASLSDETSAIQEALAKLPAGLKPGFYIAGARPSEDNRAKEAAPPVKPLTLAETSSALLPELFVGGQDNVLTLQEALETAAEQPNNAVLWIHGPQPFRRDRAESSPLDLVNKVSLYDLQVKPGPVSTLQTLQAQDFSHHLVYSPVEHSSIVKDISQLVRRWEHPVAKLALERRLVKERPAAPVVFDREVSAQVTALWAREEVARLLSVGNKQQAEKLAARYRLVTPVSGAVVLENAADYKKWQLDSGHYIDAESRLASSPGSASLDSRWRGGSGLVGAPVDPRYGQSNEVGALEDYGYDTARDISRLVTAASFVVSLFVAAMFLRSRRTTSHWAIGKAIGLVSLVPFMVHLLGTFLINNFGGLGGGL